MPLDLDMTTVRRLDMATFTGDTWALDASLALPSATVPRLIVQGSGPVRWTVYGMASGDDGAAQVADATTDIDVRVVKISRTGRRVGLVRGTAANSGNLVNIEQTETDVSDRDIVMLAIPVVTFAGTAPFLWIALESGAAVAASGVTP